MPNSPALAPTGAEVWTLTISHRHGIGASVHSTEAKANAALFAWVKEWWEREVGGDMPEDPDEAVAEYFDRVEDEWAEVERCYVDEGVPHAA